MSSLNDFTKKTFHKYATAAKELEQSSPNLPFPMRGGRSVWVCNCLLKSHANPDASSDL